MYLHPPVLHERGDVFGDYVKIESIEIDGIGGIQSLKLIFNKGMNLICGPNGIGKTTILECIAHTFAAAQSNILKRNVNKEVGTFTAQVECNGQIFTHSVSVNEVTPNNRSDINGLHQYAQHVLSLKVYRTFTYQSLDAVGKDPGKNINNFYQEVKDGLNIYEVKNWFVNRFLYSAHEGALSDIQQENLLLAKQCFSALSEGFSFSRVLAASNEIMVNTPQGEIYYEYLSSGFKSSLSIIFGVIKEIELRFKSPEIRANEFDGIVLIDEIELHLHPEWQAKIVSVLVEVFPRVQFIATTHSPHVIQNAKSQEIMALDYNEDTQNVFQRELPNAEYGFQGWTVEEVLLDVMGMSDIRTTIFEQKMNTFEKAIDSEHYSEAREVFDELNIMLHPNNPIRKMLRFQMMAAIDSE